MAKKKVIKKRSRNSHDKKAFAGGFFLGGLFLLLTFASKIFGIFGETTNILLDLYGGIGYDVSYFGVLLGGVYGFLTGFILFYIYSWIYNKFDF